METTIEKSNTNQISKRGGARVGAGRKPKMQYEARELFNMAVDARWPLIMQKIDELIQKGDKDILKMIVEQRIGKPTQSVAVKNDGNPRVNYNFFIQPKVQEAVRVFEDQLKKEIMLEASTSPQD